MIYCVFKLEHELNCVSYYGYTRSCFVSRCVGGSGLWKSVCSIIVWLPYSLASAKWDVVWVPTRQWDVGSVS